MNLRWENTSVFPSEPPICRCITRLMHSGRYAHEYFGLVYSTQGTHRRKYNVCRANTICVWGDHGHAHVLVGSVPSPLLDLGYPFYRFQLFTKFIYRLLPTKLVDEKVWYEDRSGIGFRTTNNVRNCA